MKVFITGGTGFVGRSLLERFEALAPAGSTATVLTRDPASFARTHPDFAGKPWLSLVAGDILQLPDSLGPFEGVIHAAASSDAVQNAADPQALVDTIVVGTRNILQLAAGWGDIPLLFASSGAVYGEQPPTLERIPESYGGAPNPLITSSAYAEAKRLAELECILAAERFGVQPKIARMFTFVGPHLPVRRHFAIGSFIANAREGGPISVRGDGTAVRSYLDADDMADWLWAILRDGATCRAYNVGSERAITIAQLADLIASLSPRRPEVRILGERRADILSNRYVPDTSRARSELGLKETRSLESSIAKLL